MWQEIGLFGRDDLLSKKVYPRVRGRGRFYLTGQRGVGKTAVLEWTYQNSPEPKALLSTTLSPREFLIQLCVQLKFDVPLDDGEFSIERKLSRMTKEKIEELLVKSTAERNIPANIFIDDIEKIKPTILRIFSFLTLHNRLFFAGISPFKDDLKKYLWGAVEIELPKLKRDDIIKIVEETSKKIGRIVPVVQICNASNGIPGRAVQMVHGEIEWKKPARTQGEEINIAPVLLFVLVVAVTVRYISLGLNLVDLYILGGIGAGLGIFLRFFIYRMVSKR